MWFTSVAVVQRIRTYSPEFCLLHLACSFGLGSIHVIFSSLPNSASIVAVALRPGHSPRRDERRRRCNLFRHQVPRLRRERGLRRGRWGHRSDQMTTRLHRLAIPAPSLHKRGGLSARFERFLEGATGAFQRLSRSPTASARSLHPAIWQSSMERRELGLRRA